MTRRALSLMLVSLIFSPVAAVGDEPAAKQPASKLAVLVVFDQMRGDYLTRWDSLFGDGGFHRLEKEGAWFQNCHYPYGHTVTGAGHASILTGCMPNTHGIVANEWYDRASGQEVYCATLPRYERVPPLPGDELVSKPKPKPAGAPDRLLAPTLGDALKDATAGKGRVVALSLKDRGCILPAGHKPDAVYWFDTMSGTFVTSTYYGDRLHPWVEEFNQTRPANKWFGQEWNRLLPDLDYERYSGPDDQPGEGKGIFQGRAFPHPMNGGMKKPGKLAYDALYNSPFGNEMLLDLVKRAIDAEGLGTHDTPDLLTISFSCNDPIGHCWGPDSQEVLDVTLRSDRIIKELLATLDAKVGKGRYTLVLTADHGVCPLPEVARKQGKESDRILPSALAREAESFLDETYGKGDGKARWVEHLVHPWIYLNFRTLREHGLKQSNVEETLAGWLKKQPGMQTAYTRTQMLQGVAADDTIGQAVRRSFHPDRSGEVTMVVKPFYQVTTFLTGTGHGTPHPYDTHVPLLVFGPDVQPAVRKERVAPPTAAAILAHAIGIKPPQAAEYAAPEGLFPASKK
jgi:predicted AlkP superfamily pyrophosphatase or phosphodiesterase